jgi:hypothetical protein
LGKQDFGLAFVFLRLLDGILNPLCPVFHKFCYRLEQYRPEYKKQNRDIDNRDNKGNGKVQHSFLLPQPGDKENGDNQPVNCRGFGQSHADKKHWGDLSARLRLAGYGLNKSRCGDTDTDTGSHARNYGDTRANRDQNR